ncbi:MAG: hypothetical protein HXX08_04990 [Chloroflexi bacterium]|uniref:DUF624 domain-containing protein n=1 Tax=Candidatus Chlorohelix allophototropha TaxID=3003348 RepID=A0A8T7M022_9CHLR|nr:hypothetical protein [Chloroflexota bacterium]WJW67095.1 hypothetical protein OZ401_000346 [Chloroflexota bacterium L227-S17]
MFNRIIPVFLRALADLWDNLLVLVLANILWAISLLPAVLLLNLPVPVPYVYLISILPLIVLGGPATIGLFSLTANVTRLERLELGEFFKGIRTYYWRGIILAILNLIFAAFAYINLAFYASINVAGGLVSILWLWLIFFWLVLQVSLWPMAISIENRLSLRLLFRNSLLATFKYLFFTLLIGIVLGIILCGSYYLLFLPTVLFGMSYHTLVSNNALQAILDKEKLTIESKASDNEKGESDSKTWTK